MSLERHRDFRIQKLSIGAERAPLMVIDNVVANPDELVEIAATKTYGNVETYYPGIRAKVPLTFQRFLLDILGGEIREFFGLDGTLRFTSCHFSLVTTRPDQLSYLQRVPHVDSLNSKELALVYYLFKTDLGGTAFYRHRNTGFEVVDATRNPEFWRHLQVERAEVERTSTGYISGDTPFYEQIGQQEGVFNRMLVYRRTSLHSGTPKLSLTPETDPRKGRLSINGFIA